MFGLAAFLANQRLARQVHQHHNDDEDGEEEPETADSWPSRAGPPLANDYPSTHAVFRWRTTTTAAAVSAIRKMIVNSHEPIHAPNTDASRSSAITTPTNIRIAFTRRL
jgi:hypothetical protein